MKTRLAPMHNLASNPSFRRLTLSFLMYFTKKHKLKEKSFELLSVWKRRSVRFLARPFDINLLKMALMEKNIKYMYIRSFRMKIKSFGQVLKLPAVQDHIRREGGDLRRVVIFSKMNETSLSQFVRDSVSNHVLCNVRIFACCDHVKPPYDSDAIYIFIIWRRYYLVTLRRIIKIVWLHVT